MYSRIIILFLLSGLAVYSSCSKKDTPQKSTQKHGNNSTSAITPQKIEPKPETTKPLVNPTKTPTKTPLVKTVKIPLTKKEEPIVIPKDPYKKAQLFYSLGYGRSAVKLLKNHKKEIGISYDYWILRSRAAYLSGQYRDLLSSTVEGLKTASTNLQKSEFNLLRGRAYIKKRNFPAAMRNLKKSIKNAPSDHRSRISLLFVYTILKNVKPMEKLLTESITVDPNRGEYLLAKADLLIIKKKKSQAKEYLKTITTMKKVPRYIQARAFDRYGMMVAVKSKNQAKKVVIECRKRFPSYGCVSTEMAISPPDPQNPNRKIRSIKRTKKSKY
jgi:tetratricopeptide (TPR) repeat protein